MTIKLPKHFDYRHFNDVLQQRDLLLASPEKHSELIFDVSETEYTSILGLLLIVQMCDAVEPACKCTINYGKPKKDSFIAGFARIMGLIKTEKSKELEDFLDDYRVPVQRCLNGQESLDAVNQVIRIIKKEFKPSDFALAALNWALWEFVDNSAMHGYGITEFGANFPYPVYFCAFNYEDTIDIATIDVGRGILNSLLSSGKEQFKNLTNEEALRLCIQDKVSGTPQRGSMGFGLYGCLEIAKQASGRLVIISGNTELVASSTGVNIFPSSNFSGTMVSLSIPRASMINLVGIFGEKSLIFDSMKDLLGEFHG